MHGELVAAFEGLTVELGDQSAHQWLPGGRAKEELAVAEEPTFATVFSI